MCLRWTHDGINSILEFRDGRSVFQELVLPLWRNGWTWSSAVPPMDVVLDETGNLWCLANRRLAGFRMLQALSADTVWVRCWIFDEGHKKFKSSKTTRNGGTGVKPNILHKAWW